MFAIENRVISTYSLFTGLFKRNVLQYAQKKKIALHFNAIRTIGNIMKLIYLTGVHNRMLIVLHKAYRVYCLFTGKQKNLGYVLSMSDNC